MPVRALRARAALATLVVLAGCGSSSSTIVHSTTARMTVTSPAFAPGGPIPRRFTCDGQGSAPPLSLSRAPSRTASLALVVVDPDAPGGFTHWVAFDIPPATRALTATLPAGTRQGRSSSGAARYTPPCPPPGEPPHHYVFTLYALSRAIDLPNGAPAASVEAAISRTAIASGQLVGRYGR